jgi:hypothetical protein
LAACGGDPTGAGIFSGSGTSTDGTPCGGGSGVGCGAGGLAGGGSAISPGSSAPEANADGGVKAGEHGTGWNWE